MKILNHSLLVASTPFFILQILSVSRAEPGISMTIEAVLTCLMLLMIYWSFARTGVIYKITSILLLLYGLFYFFASTYFYYTENAIYYNAIVGGLICIVFGFTTFMHNNKPRRDNVMNSWIAAIIPILYIVLLSVQKPYPYDSNIQIISLQTVCFVFSYFLIAKKGNIYCYAYISTVSLLAIFFIVRVLSCLQDGGMVKCSLYILYCVFIAISIGNTAMKFRRY